MKQGWLMLTAVAGLGLLSACSKPEPAEVAHGAELVIASEAQFADQVENSSLPVLVDFWATWCPPCKKMNPIIAEVSAEYKDRLTVAKVDVDQNPALSDRFKIESIPTMMIFKGGKPVAMRVGGSSKGDLTAWLNEQLAPTASPE